MKESGKKGYAGSIKNTGSQVVPAPFKQKEINKGKTKKGGDLRNG